jgi:hypothetical protein
MLTPLVLADQLARSLVTNCCASENCLEVAQSPASKGLEMHNLDTGGFLICRRTFSYFLGCEVKYNHTKEESI